MHLQPDKSTRRREASGKFQRIEKIGLSTVANVFTYVGAMVFSKSLLLGLPVSRWAHFSSVLLLCCTPTLLRAQDAQPSAPVPLSSLPVLKNAESGNNIDKVLFADQSPAGAAVPLGDFEAAGAAAKGYLWLKKEAPLTLGNRTYTHGLMNLHGSSSWSYALEGKYTGITAEVGQFDGAATLRLFGDGKLLHDTGRLPNRDAVPFLVDLRGVKELKFVVSDTITKGNPHNTTVVIGNPRLSVEPLPDTQPVTGPNSSNKPPEARIEAAPVAGQAPLEVTFRGDKSTDSDGQVNRYTWHFGDGASETLAPNPKHTFAEPGIYEVLLLAEDAQGGIGSTRQLVKVLPATNQAPVASVAVSGRVVAPQASVSFDASASSDLDGAISSYEWDFGDGQKATGPKVEHAFAKSGRYPVALTLTDDKAAKTKWTTSLRVATPQELSRPFPLQKGGRVLIIGNSLVSFHGMIRDWLKTFDSLSAEPLGLQFEGLGKSMGKLEEYATWDRLGIHTKIDEGWDVVLIQPWTEAYDEKVSDEDLLKHATTLVNWVRASGAYPVIYEPQYDWIFFKRYQARGHERLMKIAETLDTGYLPAGQGWVTVEKDYPQPVLPDSALGQGMTNDDPKAFNKVMFADTVHQSYSGALFNSLMVWKYLTGRSPKDLTIPEAKNLALGEDVVSRVRWDLVPYFQQKADEAITPAQEKLR
jgi:PKD repeat protein